VAVLKTGQLASGLPAYGTSNTCHRSRLISAMEPRNSRLISAMEPRNSVTEGAPARPHNGTTELKEHSPAPFTVGRPPLRFHPTPRHQHREEGGGARMRLWFGCPAGTERRWRHRCDAVKGEEGARCKTLYTFKYPDAILATYF
jgi:hypothetical protein